MACRDARNIKQKYIIDDNLKQSMTSYSVYNSTNDNDNKDDPIPQVYLFSSKNSLEPESCSKNCLPSL